MSKLKQVLAAALELPREEQDALLSALAEHKRAQLLEYAHQAALAVRAGNLKPQSIAEMMQQLDDGQ